MTFNEFQKSDHVRREITVLPLKQEAENRRFGTERRQFTYTGFRPERRTGKDRRKNNCVFHFETE